MNEEAEFHGSAHSKQKNTKGKSMKKNLRWELDMTKEIT